MEHLLNTHLNAWQYIVLLSLLLSFSFVITAYIEVLIHNIEIRTEDKPKPNSFYVLWNPFLLINDKDKSTIIFSEIFLTLITFIALMYKCPFIIERALSPFDGATTFSFNYIKMLIIYIPVYGFITALATFLSRTLFPTIFISVIILGNFGGIIIGIIFLVLFFKSFTLKTKISKGTNKSTE